METQRHRDIKTLRERKERERTGEKEKEKEKKGESKGEKRGVRKRGKTRVCRITTSIYSPADPLQTHACAEFQIGAKTANWHVLCGCQAYNGQYAV